MKHRNWKKTVVAAAAICILGTMTAVAVGRPAFILSGSSRNEIVRIMIRRYRCRRAMTAV